MIGIIGVSVDKTDQGPAEAVVHGGIELVSQYPRAGVIPDFSDDDGLRVDRFDALAEFTPEFMTLVRGYIQAPASRLVFDPPASDTAVLRSINKVTYFLDLGKDGQAVKTPPGIIVIGPLEESVPIIVGRILALVSAHGRVTGVAVKIQTVGGGVVEDPIEDDVDAHLLGLVDKTLEGAHGSKVRIDAEVVRCIVEVVGRGFEDGIEVNGGDP